MQNNTIYCDHDFFLAIRICERSMSSRELSLSHFTFFSSFFLNANLHADAARSRRRCCTH